MSEHLAKLNPEQMDVVRARGHCLAIACPGSGKTSTAASKAACLLGDGERVAAVTFTKDAALELRERIIKIAGVGSSSRLLVGTFHSICLLMAFPGRAKSQFGRDILASMKTPFTTEWELVNAGVQFGYVSRAIREVGLSIKVQDAMPIIELAKESGTVEQLDDELGALVTIYNDLLVRAGKIDFQDIILNVNKAMRNGTLSAMPIGHLLVDEFQDTDLAQYEWIRHHAMGGVSVTAVGDDDQSIYGFRRALGYSAMEKFTKEFGADRILLGTNYRCRSEILGAAQKLINRNTERIGKRLHAAKGEGGTVMWESFASCAAEASAVAEEAFLAIQEGASFAVIAHTNRELIDLQKAMVLRDIPFRKADGKSLFDCPEVQTYAALLRALIRPMPNDIDQVLAWTGMAESDTKEIRRLFGASIRMGSANDFTNSRVTESGRTTWRAFAKRYNEWVTLLEQGSYALLNLGVHEWLLDTLQKPNSQNVLQIAEELFDPRDKTLAKHLSDLRGAEARVRQEEKGKVDQGGEPKNVVWLITAHGSKGLEFDRVWIIGVQSGSFPSEKSSLEEERRLMFVAMTRAKESLWVSGTKDKKPSMFVYEAELLPSANKGT